MTDDRGDLFVLSRDTRGNMGLSHKGGGTLGPISGLKLKGKRKKTLREKITALRRRRACEDG